MTVGRFTCNECGESKNSSSFRVNGKGYRYKKCKACCYGVRREWIRNHPKMVLGEQQRSRAKNAQLLRDSAKAYVAKYPERVAARLARTRFSRSLYSSTMKARLRGHVACTATEDQIEIAFTGKCFVCGISEDDCRVRLHMDHNHSTGKFRGWLCADCNIATGKIKDNPIIAQQLANYLKGDVQ